MADAVQYRLERMTDELDDLERRGLFNRAELADVVRRRRDFEFRLRRRSPLRQDFLDYIAYELRLDSLRNLRKRAIIRDAPSESDDDHGSADEEGTKKKRKRRNKKWKKSISDVAGVLRILEIYRMATVRFKGDLDLWFKYLEFCRGKRHGRMKQVSINLLNVPSLLFLLTYYLHPLHCSTAPFQSPFLDYIYIYTLTLLLLMPIMPIIIRRKEIWASSNLSVFFVHH